MVDREASLQPISERPEDLESAYNKQSQLFVDIQKENDEEFGFEDNLLSDDADFRSFMSRKNTLQKNIMGIMRSNSHISAKNKL